MNNKNTIEELIFDDIESNLIGRKYFIPDHVLDAVKGQREESDKRVTIPAPPPSEARATLKVY